MKIIFLFLFSIFFININNTIAKERDIENYIEEITNIDKDKVKEASKIFKIIISVYESLKLLMEKVNNFISKVINIITNKNVENKQSIIFLYR